MRILHFDVLLSVFVLLKVLSNEIDMVEITVGSFESLKSEARRFLEKSARPPFCESPLKVDGTEK